MSCKHDDDGGGGSFDSALEGKWVGDAASGTLEIAKDAWKGTGGEAEGIALVVNSMLMQNTLKTVPGFDSFDIKDGKMIMKASGVTAVMYTYKIDGKTLTINNCDDEGSAESEELAFKGDKQ